MFKFIRNVFLIMIGLFAAAVVVMILCTPADAQEKKTQPQYTVVFTFARGVDPAPDVRIYVLVNATTEGDAAIAAHKHMSEKLTTQAAEKLVYIEAQRKQ